MALGPIPRLSQIDFVKPRGGRQSEANSGVASSMPATPPVVPSSPEKPASSSRTDTMTSKPVTFEKGADAVSKLAAQGISSYTMTFDRQNGPVTSLSQLNVRAPHVLVNGSVSRADFQTMIEQMGGNSAEADRLFAVFDADGNDSVSHGEFLKGLAHVNSNDSNTTFAQILGKLMDGLRDSNGRVDSREFSDFQTAFLNLEKPDSANGNSVE